MADRRWTALYLVWRQERWQQLLDDCEEPLLCAQRLSLNYWDFETDGSRQAGSELSMHIMGPVFFCCWDRQHKLRNAFAVMHRFVVQERTYLGPVTTWVGETHTNSTHGHALLATHCSDKVNIVLLNTCPLQSTFTVALNAVFLAASEYLSVRMPENRSIKSFLPLVGCGHALPSALRQ